jgi:hypothetical protein
VAAAGVEPAHDELEDEGVGWGWDVTSPVFGRQPPVTRLPTVRNNVPGFDT